MSAYDRWLEAPYVEQKEHCEHCDGEGCACCDANLAAEVEAERQADILLDP